MGRRLPRRMWHGVVALVLLPVIGFACLVAVPGNPVALQLELYLSGNGSTHALSKTASALTGPVGKRRARGTARGGA